MIVICLSVTIVTDFYRGIFSLYFPSTFMKIERFLSCIPPVVTVFSLFHSVECLRFSVIIRYGAYEFLAVFVINNNLFSEMSCYNPVVTNKSE